MSKRLFLLSALSAFAVLLALLATKEATYLSRGYWIGASIRASVGPSPQVHLRPSYSHIQFPVWRMIALGFRDLMALGVLWFLFEGRRPAAAAAWFTLVVASLVGITDVIEYGIFGSPTSVETLAVLLLLALFATFWRPLDVNQKA